MIALLGRAALEARSLVALARAGALPVTAPHLLPGMAWATARYGPLGAAPRLAAMRYPHRTAIVDDRGEISYRSLDEQVNRLANVFRDRYEAGQTLGILCRNHRAPLIAAFAASRAGLNTVWLNTGFSAPQAAEVAAREGVGILIHDADLTPVAADISADKIVVDITQRDDDLDALIATGSPTTPPPPARQGRLVLLTSGTTGTPKGAPRTEPRSFTLPGSLLDRMPMRSGGATVIGPPLFHGTGLAMTGLTIATGSTVVLRPRFDPAQMLADIERHRADAVCAVPVLLQRILALGPEVIAEHDTSSLRIVFCSGSALPAAVSAAFQEQFGPVIYNLYASTEVSVATLATPDVVRAHPTSVGRAALGSRIAILDDAGHRVPTGQRGRIFVGTMTPFEGYTGGGGKEIVDGMLATGDVGHIDHDGLLYVEGRDDDMIVSGGENVFPAEVEELLVGHEAIHEVAVVGVDDEEFGTRLRAFVVLLAGAHLDADQVRSYVRENLARYKVPRDVIFLDELPRNPTGKVLKRELLAWGRDVTE